MTLYSQLVNALKGQFNTLNIILFLLVAAFVLRKQNKHRLARVFAAVAVVFFLLFSTSYLPRFLVSRMESRYQRFDRSEYDVKAGIVYVHVLGAGYADDERLSPNGKLSNVSLGRVAEGLRVANLLNNSVLVVSGNIASGDESMASVYRMAAIALGFPPERIFLLEQPGTTREEAAQFVRTFGAHSSVIVVTDAVHMSRAMRFFEEEGTDPYPAPANYLVKEDDNPFAFKWVPSIQNFLLMDRILRESLGSLKGYFY